MALVPPHGTRRRLRQRPRFVAIAAAAGLVVAGLLSASTGAGSATTSEPAETTTTTPSTSIDPSAIEAPGTLILSPPELDFGEVLVGQEAVEAVTATAEGGTVEDIDVDVDGPFSVDTDCTGVELTDGQQCTFDVHFSPTTTGSVSGLMVVAWNEDADRTRASLALTGTGESESGPATTGDRPGSTAVEPPGTTAPPATSGPPPETREECDARATEARIRYVPEQEMEVDQASSVTVTAETGPIVVPTSVLPATTVVPQALRCQVRARLVGNDFVVNPDDWQLASFLGTSEVRWLWLVTPLRAGDRLLLVLEVQGMRFDDDAGDYVPAGEAFQTTAEIEVDSRPQSFPSRLNAAVTGVVTHPVFALLASTGALAFLAGLAYRRMTDRDKQPRGRGRRPHRPDDQDLPPAS